MDRPDGVFGPREEFFSGIKSGVCAPRPYRRDTMAQPKSNFH
jgi:hypothetical protein